MSPSIANLFVNVAALSNVAALLVLVGFMQSVTKSAGVYSRMSALLLMHRALYVLVIGALAWNAEHIYVTKTPPHFHDLVVEVAFAALCVGSFLRHVLAPPIKEPGVRSPGWKLVPFLHALHHH